MGGPKMRLKYVHAFFDRHGHTRYYFRCNGRRIKLPGAFASHDFLNAYAAALAEQGQDNQPSRKSAGHGTFAALAARYYASPQFLALSPASRTGYRRAIERFLVDHGHRRVDLDEARARRHDYWQVCRKAGRGHNHAQAAADLTSLCRGDRLARDGPERWRARVQVARVSHLDRR